MNEEPEGRGGATGTSSPSGVVSEIIAVNMFGVDWEVVIEMKEPPNGNKEAQTRGPYCPKDHSVLYSVHEPVGFGSSRSKWTCGICGASYLREIGSLFTEATIVEKRVLAGLRTEDGKTGFKQ